MPAKGAITPSKQIDTLIAETADWRGETLARVRKAILAADPNIVEEWKWMGSPVWSCDGIIAVGNAHKKHVKLTFANGAHLTDPVKLFNNGLEGNKWRSIDFFEGDPVDAGGLRDLIRSAIDYNRTRSQERATAKNSRARSTKGAKT